MMLYKKYEGQFEYNEKTDRFQGKVAHIQDNIHFNGRSIDELKQSLQSAVESYLKKCQQTDKKPNKPIRSLTHRQKHDEGYKNLFKHPEMIENLLKDYAQEDWIKNLDFTTLEKVNNEFIISNKLKKRSSDVVWKIKHHSTQETLYIYLLLEFQSKPDPSMPIRLMIYIGSLYLELLHQKKFTKSGKLPPILPLVLYNGKADWNISTNIQDIIVDTIPELKKYQPKLNYFLLNEQDYVDNNTTEPVKSFIDALFKLEKSQSENTTKQILQALIKLLKDKRYIGLSQAFAHWMKESLIPNRFPKQSFPEINQLEEVYSMLYENAQSWYDAERDKGIKEEKTNMVLRIYKTLTQNLDTLAMVVELKKDEVKHILKQAGLL